MFTQFDCQSNSSTNCRINSWTDCSSSCQIQLCKCGIMLVGKLPIITGKTACNWWRTVLSAYAGLLGINGTEYREFASIVYYKNRCMRAMHLHCMQMFIITARCSYASAVLGVIILSVCPSVRLSVNLSRACFVTNPKNLPAIFLYHILITANMQSKTGFPSQLKSYVAPKSRLKYVAGCPVSGCWPSC